jgi:hypothetical protein
LRYAYWAETGIFIKITYSRMRRLLLPSTVFILLLTCFSQLPAQCLNCGTGAEGAFSATSNTTIAGGVRNFTTFDISPGVTVRVTGSQPLEIYATGAVNIQGTLDVSGLNGADGVTYMNGGIGAIGVAGGGNGGNGSFSSPSGPIDGGPATGAGGGGIGQGWSGGGGAGYAAIGGSSGGVGGVGGPIYGNADLTGNTAGSGGGGGSGGYDCGAGGGGAGGGFVHIISCGGITVSGMINANGGNGGSDGTGNCGGGGGGSGGSIWLTSATVTNNGMLMASGGNGGASQIPGSPYYGVGGAGSNGRIRIDANTISGSGSIQPPTGFTGTVSGITVSISNSVNVSCFGDSSGSAQGAITGGTGTVTYAWSPSGGSAATATGLAAGCYELVVTDSLGCTDTDSICITEPSALSIQVEGDTVLCNGDCDGMLTCAAIGGTPAYSYLWSNGATGDSISGLCPGTYSATIVDANGCIISETVAVVEPTAISLSETHTDATFANSNDGSGTVTASGGTPGYTYLWTPGGHTTATADSLLPGIYTVAVTDSNGCSDTITVVIGFLVGTAGPVSQELQLFPNPAREQVRLTWTLAEAHVVRVELLDISGRILKQHAFTASQYLDARLDLREYPAGIYFFRATAGDAVETRRFTIQK